MPQCKTCESRFPNWMKIEGKRRNLSNRLNCLDCMPFKAGRGRSAIVPERRIEQIGACVLCSKPSNGRRRRLCGACTQKIHRHRVKLAGIKLLGGQCVGCGWNKDPIGLQFHHPNGDKEFSISSKSNMSWEVVKKEILKCELLCVYCHQKAHHTRDDERFLEEVFNYRGTELDF